MGTHQEVDLPPDEVERPNTYRFPSPGVCRPPRPLRNLEDEDEGRHEAPQGYLTGDYLGGEGEVVGLRALGVTDGILEAPGREADVRVGKQEPLTSGLLAPRYGAWFLPSQPPGSLSTRSTLILSGHSERVPVLPCLAEQGDAPDSPKPL